MKRLLSLAMLLFPLTVLAQNPTPFCRAYTPHATYNLSGQAFQTITGVQINPGIGIGIHLTNCHNIIIHAVKIDNRLGIGIRLDNCYNITIDSTTMDNPWTGIYAFNCTGGIKINNNQFRNVQNPTFPGTGGSNNQASAIQFNGVNGGGNEIMYNKIDNAFSLITGDNISLFKCNGLPGDHIKVIGNWIRGGGINTLFGAAGIVGGDLGGSYQDITDNILVNTGFVGLQVQGGTNILVTRNKIYGANFIWSDLGLGSANYSDFASNNNTITQNQVNWYGGFPPIRRQNDTAWKPQVPGHPYNTRPIGFNLNTHATFGPEILPTVIFMTCTAPIIAYVPSTNVYTYGYAIQPIVPTSTGTPAILWSVSPALPPGLSISTTTGVLSGTATNVSLATNYTVTASNTGGSGTAPLNITVNPANLVVTAVSKTKMYNTPNPALTVAYSGFRNGDVAADLTVQPTATTTATTGSLPGPYTITPAGGVSTKYSFTYIDGLLFITLPNVFIKYGHFGGIVKLPN